MENLMENVFPIRAEKQDMIPAVVHVDGRFAIGFPRVDGGEEINARFDLASFPAQRLRDVFSIEGYEINGPLTGEIHLYGYYREPFGFGSLSLAAPEAWGEPFDFAAAGLRFEGAGVRTISRSEWRTATTTFGGPCNDQ